MNSQASCTRQAQARIRAPKPGQICFDSIEDWEAATSWDDILLPFDFEYRGMTSQVAIQYLRAGGGGERSLIAYDEPGNVRIHVFSSGIPELEGEKIVLQVADLRTSPWIRDQRCHVTARDQEATEASCPSRAIRSPYLL